MLKTTMRVMISIIDLMTITVAVLVVAAVAVVSYRSLNQAVEIQKSENTYV